MQQQPILIWNTVRSAWEKPQTENLLCEHLEAFSETWQTSGMMRNGQVFELPMQELHTTDTESSSLPTPTAQAAKHGSTLDSGSNTPLGANLWDLPHVLPTPNTMEHREVKTPEQIEELRRRSPGGYRNLREEIINELPTPTTQDAKNTAGPSQFNRNSNPLNVEAVLMHTPQTDDAKNTGHNQDRRPTLASQTWKTQRETNWGKFEPAIKRWEAVLGRPAPEPTKPDGKENAHRLSSRFTEWMMGVPEGWITDVGLSRNDELKACGNGVVPQQAELALRILLEQVELPKVEETTHFPTPTVSDLYTADLKSSQQKEGSMHSVTLPQAVRWVSD